MKMLYYIPIIIVIFASVYLIYTLVSTPGAYDDFAQCLTDNNAVMYGTETCSACKSQKALFGSSFAHVNYIDCNTLKPECDRVGIRVYPTWRVNNAAYEGVQSLDDLAFLAGCEV